MTTPALSQRAEAELRYLGFGNKPFNASMSELDRIKEDEELVRQINRFISQGSHIKPTRDNAKGAYYDPNDKNIYFQKGSDYLSARVLAHEIGHALGRNQSKAAAYYPSAKEYAFARGYGEAEAIYNEARMVAAEEKRHGRAYDSYISGNLYPQVKGKSYAQAKDLLARQNMYGMTPSTGGAVSLTYYENDIFHFMNTRTGFAKDYTEAGLKGDMRTFVKHMADYDTFGNSKGNTVGAEGAYNRESLLHNRPQTRLKDGAYMYGDAGDDVMTGTKSNDLMLGGSGNDTLKGGGGNDLLTGNAGRDRLLGGKGYDTYRADRNDSIRDEDGRGQVFLDGRKLNGGVRDMSRPDRMIYRDGNTAYDWDRKTGTLDINGLKIENFKNGDLDIRLQEIRNSLSNTDTPRYAADSADRETGRLSPAQPRTLSVADMPPKAQELCRQCETLLVRFHEKNGTTPDMKEIGRMAAAAGVEAYRNKFPEIKALAVKEGDIRFGYRYPHGQSLYGAVNAETASMTPIEESVSRSHQVEQNLAQEAYRREMEMAQSQSRGMSL